MPSFCLYESITADSSVQQGSALSIPNGAIGAELAASDQDIRYTMDGSTDPSETSGMLLSTSHNPKIFGISDVINIRFTRGGGTDGTLHVHYLFT